MSKRRTPELRFYASRAIWGCVLALMAVLSLGSWWLLHDLYGSTQRENEQRLTKFTQGAQNNMNLSLGAIDMLLAGVDDMLRLSGQPMAEQDPAYVQNVLQLASKQNSLISSVVVIKEDGRVLAAADSLGNYRLVQIPQEWLQSLMMQPQNTQMLQISTPAESWAQARTLHVARYLSSANADEHYFAVVQVPVTSWIKMLLQGSAMDKLQVTIERPDGSTILRIPEESVQEVAVKPPLPSKAPDGVFHMDSRIDGEPALMEVVPLNYDQLRLTAALPLSAVFEKWATTRDSVVGGVLLFGVLLFTGALLMQTYLRYMQRAQKKVEDSEDTLHRAMDSIAAGFMQLDRQNQVIHWNQRYEEMFPSQKEYLNKGTSWVDVLKQTESTSNNEELHTELLQLRRMIEAWEAGENDAVEIHTAAGMNLQISQRATPEGGRVITCEDITAIRRASVEIETLAFYDALTGLPNRRLLLDRLAQATHLAQRAGWLGALMFVDLNKFKVLNDTQGHEMGDLLLQEVAQRLKASIRASDTVARLGGDEFVVMLCDLPGELEDAAKLTQRIAEKIVRRLAEPYTLKSYIHRSSASLGVTLFGHEPMEVGEVLKQADIAMYQIKTTQGSGVCFFEPHMQEALHVRAQLEADLRQAIVQGELKLYYQPQFLADGSIDGIEALIRWEHPKRGMVPPNEFIAVAEDSELIVHIGQWVLEEACHQLANWQYHPRLAGIYLAVNVSARQFRQQNFVDQVLQIIRESAVPAHLLKLELTESLVIDDMEDSISKMSELRANGVRFSMDDFGTGQSSLSYLTRLPLSQLKIDQSFVRHLGLRHTDDVVAQTIIGMAHNLGLTVIAEGVEQLSQLQSLVSFGCQRFQGYYFSRPLPANELVHFIDQLPLGQPASIGGAMPEALPHEAPVLVPFLHDPEHQRLDDTTIPPTISANAST